MDTQPLPPLEARAPSHDESSGAGLIYGIFVLAGLAYGVACLFQPYLLLIPIALGGLWAVRTFA